MTSPSTELIGLSVLSVGPDCYCTTGYPIPVWAWGQFAPTTFLLQFSWGALVAHTFAFGWPACSGSPHWWSPSLVTGCILCWGRLLEITRDYYRLLEITRNKSYEHVIVHTVTKYTIAMGVVSQDTTHKYDLKSWQVLSCRTISNFSMI